MDLVTYSLTLFASFLGLFIGIIVSNIAVEEISAASKYLKYFNVIIVPVIIFLSIFEFSQIYAIIISCVTLAILLFFKNKIGDAWIYSIIGAFLFVSTLGNQTMNIAIIIFIYGLSIATIEASKHFKKKFNGMVKPSENKDLALKLLHKYSYYIFVGIICYAVFSYMIPLV